MRSGPPTLSPNDLRVQVRTQQLWTFPCPKPEADGTRKSPFFKQEKNNLKVYLLISFFTMTTGIEKGGSKVWRESDGGKVGGREIDTHRHTDTQTDFQTRNIIH